MNIKGFWGVLLLPRCNILDCFTDLTKRKYWSLIMRFSASFVILGLIEVGDLNSIHWCMLGIVRQFTNFV